MSAVTVHEKAETVDLRTEDPFNGELSTLPPNPLHKQASEYLAHSPSFATVSSLARFVDMRVPVPQFPTTSKPEALWQNARQLSLNLTLGRWEPQIEGSMMFVTAE